MPLLLQQEFILGRFHATRWNQNAYEDPSGEWPPSPWRLLRALAARWYQLNRERGGELDVMLRDSLLTKLAGEVPAYTFVRPAGEVTPATTHSLRQYQPTSLEKSDKGLGKPFYKRPQPTLVVDGFKVLGEGDVLYWRWANAELSRAETELLQELVRRILYFGRAESACHLAVSDAAIPADVPSLECRLALDNRRGQPVLCPIPGRPLDINVLLTNTGDPAMLGRIPAGTQWLFGQWEPRRPVLDIAPPRRISGKPRKPVQVLQFSVSGRVLPAPRLWLRVAERFHGAILRAYAWEKSKESSGSFARLPDHLKVAAQLLSGKDAQGQRLDGHLHLFILPVADGRGRLARLICYRESAFSEEEQMILERATEQPLAWDQPDYAARNRRRAAVRRQGAGDEEEKAESEWQLRLIPLPDSVPVDPPFQKSSRTWVTSIAFVPPRHGWTRNGKPKPGCSVFEQVRELLRQNYPELPVPRVALLSSKGAEVPREADAEIWMDVHTTRVAKQSGGLQPPKRGYRLLLEFEREVPGPIILGSSSHFGHGLFIPEAC